jgi:AcrR family transcriptional regulator
VHRAGVSRKTFYEQFGGLQECFLAGYEACMDVLRAELLAVLEPGAPLERTLRRVLESYLGLLAREPALARTYLVEAYAAGAPAIERRQRTLTEFGGLLADLHGRALPDEAYEIVVGGVIATATARVAAGRAAELPGLAEALFDHLRRALDLA